jgi:hypothetical protein
MILRDYQLDAAMAAFQSFDAGNKSVLLVLATGLGKTIIFCKMAEQFVSLDRGRVLMIEPTRRSTPLPGNFPPSNKRICGATRTLSHGRTSSSPASQA